ncbi:hypothetical protein Tco_0585757 [Tanacetum coccineum]
MASFDYRLNPLYTIKECSSCGALYTTDYCCSKGGLVDKIVRDPNKTPDSSQRPPQNCARCGNPVDGPYCRGCALLRKKFKEDLFTYCVENGIFQDLQDTSESSNDNTNVVNAPQEPFVVKQDPGENSSQSPPHIDHNCCYECGDSLDDIFCQRYMVKAVEENCVTCGGAHSYRNCPATDGNVYRDNIQEYVSQAAVANFNQGNTSYRPPIANQIRPPGFPPVQQNQGNNQNRYNQNRGNNYNQGQIYRPPVNQPPAYQAPAYQAPAPQTQGVSKEDFQNYIKANDAVMRNMQNQMTNLTDMLSKFVNSNTASSSGSGTLPSNTITNPKEDLKGITTRSGVAYKGPTIPTTSSSSPKVVERETEATKDTVPPTNNRSIEDVQPSVVQVETQKRHLSAEPVVAPR